jgi:hypothetical protein
VKVCGFADTSSEMVNVHHHGPLALEQRKTVLPARTNARVVDLQVSWRRWCGRDGRDPSCSRHLVGQLERRGFPPARDGERVLWVAALGLGRPGLIPKAEGWLKVSASTCPPGPRVRWPARLSV